MPRCAGGECYRRGAPTPSKCPCDVTKSSAHFPAVQAKGDTSAIISLLGAIKFNGGGHLNHSIFWKNLAPPKAGGGAPPTGELATAINAQFGSLAKLQDSLSAATVGIQGSGWGWLGCVRQVVASEAVPFYA
jgi:superoxide dismutase